MAKTTDAAVQDASKPSENEFTKRLLSDPLSRTRDESKVVDVKIIAKGCFIVPDPTKPNLLRELEVGEKITVSVGRADGMKGKIKILGEPRKA